MRCLIIDKDKRRRATLEKLIEQVSFLNLVQKCSDVNSALACITKDRIDIVFCNTDPEDVSELTFLKTIANKCYVILISAQREFAAQAFELGVTDYLLVPISYGRFCTAITRAKRIYNTKLSRQIKRDYLFVKTESRFVKIRYDEICWIEALNNYVMIKTEKQSLISHSTIKDMLRRLPISDFVRVHRSYIVNVSQIDYFDTNSLTIKKKKIPIGRKYKTILQTQINVV